jgi:hypothetical protein
VKVSRLAVLASLALATPAVAAPQVTPFPATGTYHGSIESSDSLASPSRGLACSLTDGSLACFDSRAEATAAERVASLRAGSVPVAALSSCSPALTVWANNSYNGSSISINSYPGWFGLGGFSNQGSSWYTGCRSGKLADLAGGGGAQRSLPSYTGETQLSIYGYDNVASSAYRG